MIENDVGVMEGFESSVFKVTYNKSNITLIPLSSFVPFEEKNISFSEMESLKLVGKIFGIIRSLSNEMRLDELKMISDEV